jgi:hypothetical protein
MRAVAAFVCCGLLALGVGCGGRGADGGQPTLETLWRAPGDGVAIVAGTSDYSPGVARVSFLVVDKQSRVVTSPTARVWISRGLKEAPYATGMARRERIAAPGANELDASEIYVTSVRVPTPGTYWLLAEPLGARRSIRALGNVVVKGKSEAPAVGDRAIASRTPTLSSERGDMARLTTAAKPHRALYRYSVAESLAAHAPFVVAFATPRYCQSRVCGPVVDVVGQVSRRFAKTRVRFVHVEVYRDNDPAKGANRWVREWNLPTEPFTFVVDDRGKITAKLEGAFSSRELSAAVERVR